MGLRPNPRLTEAQLGGDHVYHAMFASNFGLGLGRRGKHGEAADVLVERLGADHARTRAAAGRLAEVQQRLPAKGGGAAQP